MTMGLIILIAGLVLAMGWQANRSVQAQNQTAANVLQDYAGLAADEFARRAMAATGYYGYYTVLRGLDASAAQRPVEPATGSPTLYVFSVSTAGQRVEISPGFVPSTGVLAYLADSLPRLARDPLPETGFVVHHANIDGVQHSFVFAWNEGGSIVYGIEASREWQVLRLQETFTQNVLLPASLADGAVRNEFIFLRLIDSVGDTLFQTSGSAPDTATYSREFHDEYGGLFRAHTLVAAIDPALASSLIIGGLPRSRMPIIVATIFLATGLLIAAVWQTQRENAVMRMRSNFVAEVSHELRTPLTQIRMFTESLLFERFRSADDKHRALSIINRESQRLIHMVENILRFSDGGQSGAVLESQELEPIVNSVVDEFQVIADAKDAHIESSIEAGTHGTVDGDAVRQILLNLLDNAVKYGPHGQVVTVVVQQTGNFARVSVSDQGPGIPASERERIWGSYFRLDRERGSAIAGAGIGLAVVAELLEKQHGKIHVEENEQGGARFVVELPA